jgi:hypothetical protein
LYGWSRRSLVAGRVGVGDGLGVGDAVTVTVGVALGSLAVGVARVHAVSSSPASATGTQAVRRRTPCIVPHPPEPPDDPRSRGLRGRE